MSKQNFNIHFIQECTTVRVILNFGSGFSKKNRIRNRTKSGLEKQQCYSK